MQRESNEKLFFAELVLLLIEGSELAFKSYVCSFVHPMSSTILHDIGCTEDERKTFKGKFGNLNQKEEVWY